MVITQAQGHVPVGCAAYQPSSLRLPHFSSVANTAAPAAVAACSSGLSDCILRRRFGLLFSSLGERPTASTASTVAAPLAVPLAALRMPVRMVLDCGCARARPARHREARARRLSFWRTRRAGDAAHAARAASRPYQQRDETRRDETRQRPMIREHG